MGVPGAEARKAGVGGMAPFPKQQVKGSFHGKEKGAAVCLGVVALKETELLF